MYMQVGNSIVVDVLAEIQTNVINNRKFEDKMNTEKEKRAIEYLKAFEPESEPYYLCYSGGKDSDCIRILAELAGVKHDIIHTLTTVDAPETVKYVKSIPNIQMNYPKRSMWQLIVDFKMPPTRLIRYCCKELKEQGGKGRVKVTGVRKAESVSREKNGGVVKILGREKTMLKLAEERGIDVNISPKGGLILNDDNDESRRFVEHCYRTTSTMINPIVDWTDDDVWEFLHYHGCASNPLYQCGLKRIGCIGCPMQGGKGQKADFIKYPKYRDNYIRAFDRMVKARKTAGLEQIGSWTDGLSVMRWWVGDNPLQTELYTPDWLKGTEKFRMI